MPATPTPPDPQDGPDAVPHGEAPAPSRAPSDAVPHAEASWWAEAPVPPPAGEGPAPAGATAPARSSRRIPALLAVGAVALAVVGGGVAYAATRDDGTEPVVADSTAVDGGVAAAGGPADAATVRRPGGRGEITGIDGTTLTVETEEGTRTLTTSDATSIADTTEGDLADLAVGDDVMVLGEEGDDGTITADRLVELDRAAGPGATAGGPAGPDGGSAGGPAGAEGPPPDGAAVRGGPGGGTAGQVTAVDGDTLTVAPIGEDADDTEVTVVATDATEVTVTEAIGLADLVVGDTITFEGEEDGDVVAVTSIRRGDLLMGGPGGMAGPPAGARPGTAPDDAVTSTTEA